jgi:hypothetical protein
MKKILLLLVLPMFMFAEYLYVGSSTQDGSTDGDIKIENISKTLSTSLKVGNTNVYQDIPIYVKTDSTKEVVLNISNIADLKNGSNEQISTFLSWIDGSGSETFITDGNNFTILSRGSGNRDGTTIEGYIRVKIPFVASDQTNGTYTFSDTIKTGLKDVLVTYSNDASFGFSADVALVAVASFSDTSGYTQGQKFVAGSVDFGTFSFDKNVIEKDLYIKSNSTDSYKITFENTPELVCETDSSQKIAMTYYFEGSQITAGSAFTPLNGKSDGTTSLGKLKFETESITGSKLAGNYRATVNISVTLE